MLFPHHPNLSLFKSIHILFPFVLGFVVLFVLSNMLAPDDGLDRNNTLTISSSFEFSNQDPARDGYVYTRLQVLETLLNVDSLGRLQPGLAKQWQVSDDGLNWRFELRPGVLFHDETELNATAAVNSLRAARDKHAPPRDAPVKAIRVLEKQIVEIELQRPYSSMGAIVAHYSTGILAPSAFILDGYITEAVGTGPFKIHEFAPPRKLVVSRFDNYWGRVASIPYVQYLTSPHSLVRVLKARSNQADIVFGLEPNSLRMLSNANNLTLYQRKIPRTLSLRLNSGHPLLSDIRARKALSLALDRNGIAEDIFRNPDQATLQLMSKMMPKWYLDDLSQPEDAFQQSQKLLSELGWNLNPQGVLERQGELFQLTLMTDTDRPELALVAIAVQEQWGLIGVQVTIDASNSNAIPMVHNGDLLEVALISRNYGYIADPLAMMSHDFGNKREEGWGAMNWFEPELNKRLEELQQVTEPEHYLHLAQESARLLQEGYPVLPLITYSQQSAVNNRVQGFRFDPFQRSYYLNEMELIQ